MSETLHIYTSSDRLLTFSRAAEILPEERRPTNVTWWRWWRHGIRGVKLETVLVGGRRYTTREAVERFIADLTAQSRPESSPETTRENHPA